MQVTLKRARTDGQLSGHDLNRQVVTVVIQQFFDRCLNR